jgi:hypothetical protein
MALTRRQESYAPGTRGHKSAASHHACMRCTGTLTSASRTSNTSLARWHMLLHGQGTCGLQPSCLGGHDLLNVVGVRRFATGVVFAAHHRHGARNLLGTQRRQMSTYIMCSCAFSEASTCAVVTARQHVCLKIAKMGRDARTAIHHQRARLRPFLRKG